MNLRKQLINSLKESIAHIQQFFIMLNFQLNRSDSFHYISGKYKLYINLMRECPVDKLNIR